MSINKQNVIYRLYIYIDTHTHEEKGFIMLKYCIIIQSKIANHTPDLKLKLNFDATDRITTSGYIWFTNNHSI